MYVVTSAVNSHAPLGLEKRSYTLSFSGGWGGGQMPPLRTQLI